MSGLPELPTCGLALPQPLLGFAAALPPAPPESAPWDVRKAALQARDRFDLKGRIAVAVADQGFSAGLRWEQRGRQSQLALDGPLGVGGVHITADGSVVKSREDISLNQAPAAVKSAASALVPTGGRIDDVEREVSVSRTTYVVEIDVKNGADIKAVFAEDGTLLSKRAD